MTCRSSLRTANNMLLAALLIAQAFVERPSLATQMQPVTLVVDATRAGSGLLTVHERIPAEPGECTIVYPKWIPGEHGPTGPLNDLAELRVSANGQPLDWRRDSLDLYAFHVTVPPSVHAIDADFDVLMNAPGDVTSTHAVAILNWNRALLYQDGIDSHHYFVRPSILLPPGWDFATALRGSQTNDRVDFAVVPLNMLVDSPLDMGRYAHKWTLWHDGTAFVELDAFADLPQDLDMPSSMLAAYRRVPAEAFAMYRSRHFADYHALLTLSDPIGFQGIEHHQSSDNRAADDFFTDPQEALSGGDLITHEFSHSWNGKYRRPADLTTPNYQVPQRTDLLWIYEGMNQYLGDLLSFRAGIREPKLYPEYLATVYAEMDDETGRASTPLIDLTTGAPYYYEARGSYHALRRDANDFYTEGELVWLDVDTIIRERSHGARSLDTFLQRFTQPALTGPIVKPYTREQIEALLNEVQPYDWHDFFERYVYHVTQHPPTDELERAGWRFAYSAKPNEFLSASHDGIQGWYGFGANMSDAGVVGDVRQDSPAWRAGLAPGMHIMAVDNQQFSADVWAYAMRRAEHTSAPVSLIVSQTGWFQTLSLDYHGGDRYPHLVRVEGRPDMLAGIAAPHAN